jgi:hypothetical protein
MITQSQDTARSLSRRCHHGNEEALRALLLSTADGLYSAALGASADESQAQELAAQSWEAFLGGLGRGRAPDSAELALQRALGVEIAGELGPAAADRAMRLWADADISNLLPAPPLLIERLEEMSTASAPAIARRARNRRLLLWAGRATAALWLVVLLVVGAQAIERLAVGRTREMQLEALRERVQAQRLTWAVRDALLNLSDPQGADRHEAAVLAQIELLLGDLSAGSFDPAHLRNLQQRIAQNHLLWRLREMSQEAPPAQHTTLSRVTLLLEEAANL